jgi:RHS repeat-associated protein
VTAGYRTKYAYDTLGNLVTVTQQKGTAGTTQTRSFAYNSLSQLTDATNPESGHIVYDYDANGNLLHKTDARLVITTYEYDALNRNKTMDYSDTTGINPDITRLYDGAANGKGRLWESYAGGSASVGSNVEHTKVTTYDALGRPLSQLQEFKTNGVWSSPFTTQRSYNRAGGVNSQTYPSVKSVAYSYDYAGRTSSFTGNLGDGTYHAYSTEIIYSPLGGMTKEKFGTDPALYNKLFYNSRGQLAEIREGTSYTGPSDDGWERGAIINFYGTCWGMCGGQNSTTAMPENNGNLRRQEIYIPSGPMFAQTFDYDTLNRLQRVTEGSSWQQEYVYDRYGNRTINASGTTDGINKQIFEVETATNRLLATGDSVLTGVNLPQRKMRYDPAGNLTNDNWSSYGSSTAGAITRTYDGENRMSSAYDSSGGISYYTYNADGQRVRRKTGTVETWQVYGMEGELLAEYAANTAAGSPQKEYGYRNGQLLITATLAVSGWGAPPSFTPPAELVSGGDIKLEHLTELRTAVNQLRSHAGLAAASFPVDPSPERYVTTVKADHILQLRSALEGARLQLGLSTGYAHPGLHATDFIFAIDFQELRDQILSAWNSGGTAGGIEWLVADQLGTPRMVFDQTGALATTKRHDYLPFGEEISAGTGSRTTGQGYVADNVRQKFTSKERDNETGLDFFEARYYASTQGRFTSVDPVTLTVERLVDPQRINLYAYCRNNPLAFIDPTGEIVTFANDDAKKQYEEYLKFLNTDKDKYANELATVNRLQDSEVEYRLSVGGNFSEGAEGNTTTDGKRINIAISNVGGGSSGETFSLNSRFSHELEHGRQFDNGELIFYKGADGSWHPNPGIYDIGDEVKAWKAQLNTSIGPDYWKGEGKERQPSLLREFANAKTDDERAGVLARSAYPNRNPKQNTDYVYAGKENYKAGQLVRTNDTFGRVNRVAPPRPK